MAAKKQQYWFKILEPSGLELTLYLSNHKKVNVHSLGGKGWSKGRFTFEVDEPGLEDITFQITTHDKLGIFAPVGLDVNEVIMLIKPIMEQAVSKTIKLQQYKAEHDEKEKPKVPSSPKVGKPKADPKEIRDYLRKIDAAIDAQDWKRCHSWLATLKDLCIKYRTGFSDELLDAINRYVAIDPIMAHPYGGANVDEAMVYVIKNEREAGDEETAKKVLNALLPAVNKMLNHSNDVAFELAEPFMRRFLEEAEDKESVDLMFGMLNYYINNYGADTAVELFQNALFNSMLGKKQSDYIKSKLVDMVASEDQNQHWVANKLLGQRFILKDSETLDSRFMY